MAIMQIRTFPDPVLKQKAKPVRVFDDALKSLAESMLETMYEAEGIGLAANQVAVLKCIVVIDLNSCSDDRELDPHVFVNPKIVAQSGECYDEEGCLSVVDYRAEVKRSQEITVEYQDLTGAHQKMSATAIMAICLQHEIDHLQGILFIDHLSPLKQKIIKKRLTKQAKQPQKSE
ncbi:peptide deformylase [Deltaproteobacteria bacterium TL4]